ncbi:MAG TPA: RNA-binding S4 domain-containing protein [Gemmatimonadaceae bacterium]|jgi:ribosome-associated heat shock protein Hsp15|nr:RNA-binding S4 domain-containing protein [Gemmatimonadaceae bacterium]
MTDLTVRIDKWLWAARFFKTRSMAADAVTGGKVELNGDRVKPAKSVKVGDELKIRLGFYEHVIAVRGLSEQRGPAVVAQALYEETPESAAARAKLAERMRYEMPKGTESGRPSKKDRRDIRRLRER